MLDFHCSVGTPGAIGTLTKLATLIPTDGLNTVGVPLNPSARLVLWGASSIIANTVAEAQLIAQDCIDPRNGEFISLGSASLKNLVYKYTNIPYSTGSRDIYETSNTAQAANSLAMTLDHYEVGNKVGDSIGAEGMRFHENLVTIQQTLGADVAITWKNTAFAPTIMIPTGKYALLGFYLSKSTEAHGIRFAHADFGFCLPGLPCVDHMASAILGLQKGMQDPIGTDPGFQFVALSELSKKPMIPTFKVTPAGTGLGIQSIAAAATDTPVVTLNLCKIGNL